MEPWIVVPRGLASLGNKVESVSSAAFESICVDAPDPKMGWKERLSAGLDTMRVILPEEIALPLELLNKSEDMWNLVQDFGSLQMYRYLDRSLWNGSVFGKFSARLPRASKELVAHCVYNFEERVKWDKQAESFCVRAAPMSNDVLRLRLHAPPYSDRDYVVHHVVARHTEGRGFLVYNRQADDALIPPSKEAVRGRWVTNLMVIMEDPMGGVIVEILTANDPRIPFVSSHFVNMFAQNEVKKWMEALERHCDELQASGCKASSLPCADLFHPKAAVSQVLPNLLEADQWSVAADVGQEWSVDNDFILPSKPQCLSLGRGAPSVGDDAVVDESASDGEPCDSPHNDLVSELNRSEAYRIPEPQASRSDPLSSFSSLCSCERVRQRDLHELMLEVNKDVVSL